VAIVPFQVFADSSRGYIVERHMQCMQSPIHLQSATPSGSSWLLCSMNFWSRN